MWEGLQGGSVFCCGSGLGCIWIRLDLIKAWGPWLHTGTYSKWAVCQASCWIQQHCVCTYSNTHSWTLWGLQGQVDRWNVQCGVWKRENKHWIEIETPPLMISHCFVHTGADKYRALIVSQSHSFLKVTAPLWGKVSYIRLLIPL